MQPSPTVEQSLKPSNAAVSSQRHEVKNTQQTYQNQSTIQLSSRNYNYTIHTMSNLFLGN